jgi:hypothetical protein
MRTNGLIHAAGLDVGDAEGRAWRSSASSHLGEVHKAVIFTDTDRSDLSDVLRWAKTIEDNVIRFNWGGCGNYPLEREWSLKLLWGI